MHILQYTQHVTMSNPATCRTYQTQAILYLLTNFRAKIIIIMSGFSGALTANTRELVEQVTEQLYTTQSDSPVLIKQTLLQLQ